MVALPKQYNTADLPDTGGNSVLIPEGQYSGLIVASELKETKDKQGAFLALTIVITQGQYSNTEFTERLNIVNKNSTAVEIAYKTLARISEAVGMTRTPADSNELHNKQFMFEVKNAKGKEWTDNDGKKREGTEQSEISKYLLTPVGGASVAPVAAQQEDAPQQAVATPPAGGNPFAS